jgi:putative flippase GtrA
MKKSSLINTIKRLWKSIVNRETITYAIAGALTTVVNFVSYEGLYRLGIPNLVANAMAWVIAVTFAYIVNKVNVFQSHSDGMKDEVSKVTKFFGSRVITLIIEESGLLIFTELMSFPRLVVKACLAVIVIILNYLFSKLFVFNNKKVNND